MNLHPSLFVTPVAAGIDTLHVTAAYPVKREWVEKLALLKEQAIEARAAGGSLPTVQLHQQACQVQHHGTGKGPVLLLSEDLSVIVHHRAPKGLPTVLVELRSLFLWGLGDGTAVAAVEELVRELCQVSGDGRPVLSLSRLDLCVDFTGWQPRPEDLKRFACRAQRKSELYEEWRRVGGRAKVVKAFRKAASGGDECARAALDRLLAEDELTTGAHYSGKLFTGFSWGAGCVVARLYLKTREIQKTQKLWFHAVWKRRGWRGEPVWRLEFQLRRELLKEARASDEPVIDKGRVVLAHRDGRVKKIAPPALFAQWHTATLHLAPLWNYLCSDWLSHRKPRTAQVRKRFTRQWSQLQHAGRFEGIGTHAVWRKKLENDHLRTLGQQAGYMARGLSELWALTGEEPPDSLDPDAAVNQWVQTVRDFARAGKGDVVDRALERWDGVQQRRRLYSDAGSAAL